MPGVILTVMMLFLKQLESNVVRVIKVKSLRLYLQGLDGFRKGVIGFVLLVGSVVILGTALVFVPIMLVAMTDVLQLNDKLLIIAVYGGLCALIPGVFLVRCLSSAYWLKVSKAQELIEQLKDRD